MNSKKLILLSCVVPCVFAVSTATAQMRGHRASTARMPMHRAPMLNSPSGFQRWRGGDFDRDDRFGRFNRFRDFDRDDRFRRFNRFNRFVFIDTFGFPFFYPYPYYPYPYWDYYSYGYGYQGYGNGSWLCSCSAGWLGRATTMVLLMESWDRQRDGRFARTNAPTISARTV